MRSKYDYPPGADHLPRGDDEKYRKGHSRTFGTLWCPSCNRRVRAAACGLCGSTELVNQQEEKSGS